MSNFNKTLNAFAEKLEKFHIKSPRSLERQKQKNAEAIARAEAMEEELKAFRTARGSTAIERSLEQSQAAPKSRKVVAKKSTYLKHSRGNNNTKKGVKSRRQTVIERRRKAQMERTKKTRAQKAAQTRKNKKAAETAAAQSLILEGKTRAQARGSRNVNMNGETK
jgi:hypothetical protein